MTISNIWKRVRKMKLPFNLVPAHWGLKGINREIAKIEHHMEDGFDKEIALAELMIPDPIACKQRFLDIKVKYGKITQYDYEMESAELKLVGKDLELARTEINFKHDKIPEREYNKCKATISGEPWVEIISMGINSENIDQGSMELDWNEHFITKLKESGYKGANEEAIVDQWLATLCKHIALEQFGGVGDFDDMIDQAPTPKRRPTSDGKWEVS